MDFIIHRKDRERQPGGEDFSGKIFLYKGYSFEYNIPTVFI